MIYTFGSGFGEIVKSFFEGDRKQAAFENMSVELTDSFLRKTG
jgi:hypothetical protein